MKRAMKILLAVVGAFLGAWAWVAVTDAASAQWVGAAIGWFIGYHFAGFFSYARAAPKAALAFHGPNSELAKSTSTGELLTFLEQLKDGGLLLGFQAAAASAQVATSEWKTLSEAERLTLGQILAQSCFVQTGTRSIHIYDEKGAVLFKLEE
jgi:hypothetical protein